MDDRTLGLELSTLLVEALEVGTGKQESALIAEFCREFDVDFLSLDRRHPADLPNRPALLRRELAQQLADRAPTASALLNAVVRLGGRFIAMVEETYALLRKHAATTEGTSETFRFTRNDIEADGLTISPAFLERIRSLVRVSTSMLVGRIDDTKLQDFVRPDSGELYGGWPADAPNPEAPRLVEDLLQLRWAEPELARLADHNPSYQQAHLLAQHALAAGRRLVLAAEALVASHIAALQLCADIQPEQVIERVFSRPSSSDLSGTRRRKDTIDEIERFRTGGVLGITADPWTVRGISHRSVVGLTAPAVDVVVESADYVSGSGVGDLAGFIALWRQERWGAHRELALRNEILPAASIAEDWLRRLVRAAGEATAWLRNDILRHDQRVTAERLTEMFEEYLNLPLWRQRSLLYEVWVLCTTLTACEQAGWSVRLNGVTEADGTWVLARGATKNAVAALTKGQYALEVWREPRRQTPTGILTPDVTVSTLEPYRRDLAVIEAKDRAQMESGVRSPSQQLPSRRHARGVADRYARGLVPVVTWVCNHNDFWEPVDPSENLGHAWSRIHLADRFRPGEVPTAFADSIRDALRRPSAEAADSVAAGAETLILAVDITLSMKSRVSRIIEQLSAPGLQLRFASYRAVQFGDHFGRYPVLVSESGPFEDLNELVKTLSMATYRQGSANFAAIEDALNACNALAADAGPCTVAIVSDGVAHDQTNCPKGIFLEQEAIQLMNSGASLQVADDWVDDLNKTWTRLADRPRFRCTSFSVLLDSWRVKS